MAAKLKTKRTSITTMGAKIQAFDIFQTPLSSHYLLPLKVDINGKRGGVRKETIIQICLAYCGERGLFAILTCRFSSKLITYFRYRLLELYK
jgi:hypothetical protein